MHIWLVILNLDGNSGQNFIESGLCGMGWRTGRSDYNTKNEYYADMVNLWSFEKADITKTCEKYHRISKGDLILTRVGIEYYIGLILDEAPFYATWDNTWMVSSGVSWARRVKWYKIGKQDETPACIVFELKRLSQREIEIRHDKKGKMLYNYCKIVFNHLSNSNHFKIPKGILTADNFSTYIDEQNLLDIISLYLIKTYGLLPYPSSVAEANKNFKLVFKEPESGRIAYLQAVVNERINVMDYITESYGDRIIYLFSNLGYGNKAVYRCGEIYFIEKDDLFRFLKSNISLLQDRIKYDLARAVL